MPRLWSTAWSLGLTSSSQATSTRKLYLQHLDSFYRYCDERFGADAFDEGMSTRDAEGVMLMVESFYLTTTSDPAYNTTDVQRWGVVRAFVQSLAKRLAPSNPEWAAAASMLAAMGRMRAPRLGGFRFIRALPKTTLLDLLEVAHPSSPRNPFKGYQTRVRNWLIVNLMLLAGLRRGEALLLACDSLKEDVDPESGEVVRWLDITTVFENDPRSTTPRIKILESHRQIPVSEDLALLYQHFAAEHRPTDAGHGFLLTTKAGAPLSAEALSKVFRKLTDALAPEAIQSLFDRSGGKTNISPHDLRHTCATARYTMFMELNPDRELAIQRMRAFFGWSARSAMPEHYARAAIQDDLMQAWNTLFAEKTSLMRGISA